MKRTPLIALAVLCIAIVSCASSHNDTDTTMTSGTPMASGTYVNPSDTTVTSTVDTSANLTTGSTTTTVTTETTRSTTDDTTSMTSGTTTDDDDTTAAESRRRMRKD